MKTICFFGHRRIIKTDELADKLVDLLKNAAFDGKFNFLIGRHGEFDNIALNKCLEFRNNFNKDICITIVLTNLSILNKDKNGYNTISFFEKIDCETLIYEIEEVHFKNRITFSNRKMVDNSDLVVCCVDFNKQNSGAKNAVEYAKKSNKSIINLFSKQ